MKILILGATGMLGRAVSQAFQNSKYEVFKLSRDSGFNVDERLVASRSVLGKIHLSEFDWIVNCIGVTKSNIDSMSPQSVRRATLVNAIFPNFLAEEAKLSNVKVLQVATDCVFSGNRGSYVETDPHDPLDVYGKTKSLGEANIESVMHLRCSLIGPEAPGRSTLFYEWVRNLEYGAKVSGFTNHFWNGLTSVAFAKILAGIVGANLFESGVHHLVPSDSVDKHSLVQMLLRELGRRDVLVEANDHEVTVDRTLATNDSALNHSLFCAGGYDKPLSISRMLEEQAQHSQG